MKYKNIIFDLDGTLLDTSEGIKLAVIYTLTQMGCNSFDETKLDEFIGPPIQNSLINFLGCSEIEAQMGARIFRDYYKDKSLLKAIPYKGIYDLLGYITNHNMNIAVATYKREDYAIDLLKEFSMDKYCKVIHGADHFNKLKKTDIIMKCISELDGGNEKSLYIGDTLGDYYSAQECGIDFIGVTYGFGFKAGVKYEANVVDNCPNIINWLNL